MRRKFHIAVLAAASVAAMLVYFRWSSAIRQPLDFSHAAHVRQNIRCESCHAVQTSETLPAASQCVQCHKGMNFPTEVRWIHVYRVAPYIIFAHAKHTGFSCATCHKAMTSAKRWVHESRFKMDFCMDCHAKSRAKNECGTCHKHG